MRAATGGRWIGVGAAVLLVGAGAGCAQESDADLVTATPAGFEATPSYVGQVIDASESEPYRYSMDVAFDMFGQSADAQLATGAFDGERSQMSMDLGALLEQMGSGFGEEMPAELADADLSMETVTDTDAVYLRAPFVQAMTEGLGEDEGDVGLSTGADGMLDVYDAIGDGWGKVDIDALGDVLPADAERALSGGQSADPTVFLDMLRETSEVRELGTDEIDGVEVHGLAADVDLGDLMAASGTDPSAMSSGSGGEAAEGLGDLSSFTFPLEVWVDGDNHVRRITYTFDQDSFGDIAEAAGEDAGELPSEMGNFSIGMTMDFSDYGDDSISVDVPSDAVDVTDEFVTAYQEMNGG
jgi:hypothetical protein